MYHNRRRQRQLWGCAAASASCNAAASASSSSATSASAEKKVAAGAPPNRLLNIKRSKFPAVLVDIKMAAFTVVYTVGVAVQDDHRG